MSQHIIGDERTRGSSGRDNRMFVEAGVNTKMTRLLAPGRLESMLGSLVDRRAEHAGKEKERITALKH